MADLSRFALLVLSAALFFWGVVQWSNGNKVDAALLLALAAHCDIAWQYSTRKSDGGRTNG